MKRKTCRSRYFAPIWHKKAILAENICYSNSGSFLFEESEYVCRDLDQQPLQGLQSGLSDLVQFQPTSGLPLLLAEDISNSSIVLGSTIFSCFLISGQKHLGLSELHRRPLVLHGEESYGLGFCLILIANAKCERDTKIQYVPKAELFHLLQWNSVFCTYNE